MIPAFFGFDSTLQGVGTSACLRPRATFPTQQIKVRVTQFQDNFRYEDQGNPRKNTRLSHT